MSVSTAISSAVEFFGTDLLDELALPMVDLAIKYLYNIHFQYTPLMVHGSSTQTNGM